MSDENGNENSAPDPEEIRRIWEQMMSQGFDPEALAAAGGFDGSPESLKQLFANIHFNSWVTSEASFWSAAFSPLSFPPSSDGVTTVKKHLSIFSVFEPSLPIGGFGFLWSFLGPFGKAKVCGTCPTS